MHLQTILERVDQQRRRLGFLTIGETVALAESNNAVLDPFSTLISAAVQLGRDNMIYPGVTIQAVNGGLIEIADRNIFYPATIFVADVGNIHVGSDNQFGDGGCSVKANQPQAHIEIGNGGRFVNGPEIIGQTKLGSGTQIIGRITAQDCVLQDGESFRSADPDRRGSVLKGFGLARALRLQVGDVLQGAGSFDIKDVKRQSHFHPMKS